MRKAKRSLLSILLIISMIAGSFAYGAVTAEAEAGSILYEENFDEATISSLQSDGWVFPIAGAGPDLFYQKAGDALRGRSGNAYYGSEEAFQWTDYTYESKMTITTKKEGNEVDGYFGIRFGIDSSGEGMEYGIHYKSADNSYTYRVYDRSTKTWILYEKSLTGKGLAMDKEMTLKVKVDGKSFTLYLNGEELETATMSEPIVGTIGTVMSCGMVYLDFDDMVVTKNPEVPGEEDGVFFREDFSDTGSMMDRGWNADRIIKEEKLTLEQNQVYLTRLSGAAQWTDYTTVAEVSLGAPATILQTNVAAVSVRASNGNSGYEFGIQIGNKDETGIFRLYDRRTGTMLAQSNGTYTAERNKTYQLKVVVTGNRIICYADDQRIFDLVDEANSNPAGFIGLRSTGNGYYDNIVVREVSQDDIDGVFFREDFSDTGSMMDRGWNADRIIKEEKLTLEQNQVYLTRLSGAAQWTDYTTVAEVSLGAPATILQTNVAAVSVRASNGNSGYEFGIQIGNKDETGIFRLYDRRTGTMLAQSNGTYTAERNKTYQLKVVVTGNRIICYADDQRIFDLVDEANSNPAGFIGLRSTGNGYYDNIVVREINPEEIKSLEPTDPDDPPEPEDPNTLYKEDFDAATIPSLQEDGWIFHLRDNGTPYYEMKGDTLRGITGNAYYNNEEAYQWANYIYESKMTIATKYDDGRTEEGWLGLRFGVDRNGEGLEYAIHYVYKPETGYSFSYRVYDRNARTHVVPEAPLTNMNLAKDQEMTLKVKLDGKSFTIYLNDVELGGGIMPEPVTGTIGTFMNSTTVYLDFDDMLVTQNQATGEEEEEGDIAFLVNEDFDEYSNEDKPVNFSNGWRTTNNDAVVRDGKLLLNTSANLYGREDFVNGYVSADILLEDVSDAFAQAEEATTVYPVSLTAKNTFDMHEFRARIALMKKEDGEYSAQMQVVVYSRTDYEGPQVYSYPITDFAFGKTYNLKIICVGNYFAVAMDDILLFERACATTHGLYERQGIFGISTVENTANVLLDNVQIVKYTPKQVKVHESCAEEVSVYSYPDLIAGTKESYQRTAFYVGEHVKIQIFPQEGYVLDKGSLKYMTASGVSQAIVDYASDTLYGFFMPDSDVVVSAAFVPGRETENDIFFTEDFDGENSMLDNGWNANGNIINGRLFLDSNMVYLTGLSDAARWSDYAAIADVCLSESNKSVQISAAAVCVRMSGNSSGYEFGIQIGTNAQTGNFRLYDRTTGTMLAQGTGGLTVERDKTYQLKVVVQGNRIICFADGVCVFDVIDSANSNPIGTIGLRTNAGNGYYDNIVVRKIDPEELKASSAEAGTATVPKTGDTTEPGWLWLLAGLSFTGALCLGCLGRRRYGCYVKRRM